MKKAKPQYAVTAFINITALFLPSLLYLLTTTWIFPAPNSGFLVLGYIGCFVFGVGLVFIVAKLYESIIGKTITAITAGIGALLISISSIIMYVPSIYFWFNEGYVTFYFLVWIILAVSIIYYLFFRHAVLLDLRHNGMSKTAIKKALKGVKNYWWYAALKASLSRPLVYWANTIYTILLPICVLLHLVLGWWSFVYPVITTIVCVLLLINLPMFYMVFITWDFAHSEPRPKKTRIELLTGFVFPVVSCYALIHFLITIL